MQKSETVKSVFQSILEWAEAITAAFVAIVLIFAFLFRLVSVDGTSMETTLHNGERLILSRLPYTPAYEDIVVLNLKEGTEPLIKRIIGLAGDTIEITEWGGVLRNGETLDETYIHVPTATESMDGPVTVPEGYIFVMGDNRMNGCSLDSRTFGCVPCDNVLGKAVFRIAPLDRWGSLYDEL